MQNLLPIFILLPLVGFIISLLLPHRNEKLISGVAFTTMLSQLMLVHGYVIYWMIQGFPTVEAASITLFKNQQYVFQIDYLFDKISATYLIVGSILAFLVSVYSRSYLHREPGYKRFYNTILFFFLGYCITILSGNLETLFAGWEILGISSFLLISFYRERYLPTRNAVKVFFVYRIGDIGIILAMWASHHLWHKNITFSQLNQSIFVHEHLISHSVIGIFISLMFLLSASAKSAQLPFSSWLPRAMEGPTPSSAIFYGSLSVHIGVFLLIRTFPFWEHQLSVRILIGVLGACTAVITTTIARVQSSVKSQIAYASIAQIGLIFIEIALGLENLALYHFAGNAFLRTYQLLVSPSVVTYLIKEQFYHFETRKGGIESLLPKRLKYSLYLLALKEWNLDFFIHQFLLGKLKWLGKSLIHISQLRLGISMMIMIAASSYLITHHADFSHQQLGIASCVIAAYGLILGLKSFIEPTRILMSWVLIMMNHLCTAMATSFHDEFDLGAFSMYIGGIAISGAAGFIVLRYMKQKHGSIPLDHYHGLTAIHPRMAFVFLISCLGLTGFPITPAFIGEDLIFSHIHENQYVLASIISLSFVLDGIAVIRIFSRIFMGPFSSPQSHTPSRYF